MNSYSIRIPHCHLVRAGRYPWIMHRPPTIQSVSTAPYAYRVKWFEGDKKMVRYFRAGEKGKAQDLLNEKAMEVANHGTRHGAIADEERAALIHFRTAVAAMPEPRPKLMDAVEMFLANHKGRLTPITVSDLIGKRVAAAERKGVHPRTVRDLVGADGYGGRLGAFAKAFGPRMAATVTAEEIEGWLEVTAGSDANRREILVRINGLFSFGIKKRFLVDNPVRAIELPRPNPPQATFLSVTQARDILAACPARSVPGVAVQLFAGLRFAEAERLEWSDVDFNEGVLRVTQHKGTGSNRTRHRFPPLLDTLMAWITPHRKEDGPVMAAGKDGAASKQIFRKDFTLARGAAGIGEWDENTLRHSYGSYRCALVGIEKTQAELGHTHAQTTSRYYVSGIPKGQAQEFWALRPAL